MPHPTHPQATTLASHAASMQTHHDGCDLKAVAIVNWARYRFEMTVFTENNCYYFHAFGKCAAARIATEVIVA